jgi:hypothetical protein
MAVFHFIEGFDNAARRHSAPGYLSPIEYEARTVAENNWSLAANRPRKQVNPNSRLTRYDSTRTRGASQRSRSDRQSWSAALATLHPDTPPDTNSRGR